MNHTNLILGAVIIFLLAGLAYAFVPSYLEKQATTNSETSELPTNTSPASDPLPTASQTDQENDTTVSTPELESSDDNQASLTETTQSSKLEDNNDDQAAQEEVAPLLSVTAYTMADVALHGDESSCWTAINGAIYDVSAFIDKHPGGDRNILKICGLDGTAAFTGQHGGQDKPASTLAGFEIGVLAE